MTVLGVGASAYAVWQHVNWWSDLWHPGATAQYWLCQSPGNRNDTHPDDANYQDLHNQVAMQTSFLVGVTTYSWAWHDWGKSICRRGYWSGCVDL
jgi:hypothetical protein